MSLDKYARIKVILEEKFHTCEYLVGVQSGRQIGHTHESHHHQADQSSHYRYNNNNNNYYYYYHHHHHHHHHDHHHNYNDNINNDILLLLLLLLIGIIIIIRALSCCHYFVFDHLAGGVLSSLTGEAVIQVLVTNPQLATRHVALVKRHMTSLDLPLLLQLAALLDPSQGTVCSLVRRQSSSLHR